MESFAPMTLRPHRPAPWATAAVLLATVFTVPGALAQAPEEACAKGRRVQVKPQELKKKVRGATSREELKKLLDALGMTVDWSGLSCTQEVVPSVVLDVFKARLVSAEQQDLVVQARGSVCEGVRLLSGVVLYPLAGKDTWCFPRQLLIKESTTECGKFVDMPSGDSVYTSGCTEVSNEQRQCYQRDPWSGRIAYAECPSSPYGTTPAPPR